MAITPPPSGYRQIVSASSGYVIAIPSSWVYVTTDSGDSVADQATRLKAQYPTIAYSIDLGVQVIDKGYNTMLLDPTRSSAGHVVLGGMLVMAAQSTSDLEGSARDLETQLKSTYNVLSIVVSTTQEPAGPTIRVQTRTYVAGFDFFLVEYLVLAPQRSYLIVLLASASEWPTYGSVFDVIPSTLSSF
jgi:hypothetical protein